MVWYTVLLVLLVGFVAGFINTVSGSGSLLTLPLLIFLGLPANVANGTNRISVLFQTATSSYSYYRKKTLDLRTGLKIAFPAILGSIPGAIIAVDLNEKLMKQAIGVLLLVMLVIILVKPERWLKKTGIEKIRNGPWQIVLFFIIGLYGGFIQAGVGLFLLAALVLGTGMDIVKANSYKNFLVLCFTFVALIVFIWNGQVQYFIGIVLAAGSTMGAWVAVRLPVSGNARFIGYFLITMILVSALHLLGAF